MDATLGSITAGGQVLVVVNSPGANIGDTPERVPLDDVVQTAIAAQVHGCANTRVPFRSPHLVAALMKLDQSFVAFCFDEACAGYDQKVREKLDNFLARQLRQEAAIGYLPVDLSIDPVMVEAARIALVEKAKKVDERHVFLAFLKSTSGFRDNIARDLGNDRFARLQRTAQDRIPTPRDAGGTGAHLFE